MIDPLPPTVPIPTSALIDPDLSSTARVTYAVLRLLGPRTGDIVRVTLAEISKLVGVKRQAVALAIRQLEEFGYVRQSRGESLHGRSAVEIRPLPTPPVLPATLRRSTRKGSADCTESGQQTVRKSDTPPLRTVRKANTQSTVRKADSQLYENRTVENSPLILPPIANSNTVDDDVEDEPFICPPEAESRPDPIAPSLAVKTNVEPAKTPKIRNDPALVEDAAEFAERHWPETYLVVKVRMFGGAKRQPASYWIGDLQAALIEMRNAALNKHIGNPWAYLRSILTDYALATGNLESLHDPIPRMPRPAQPSVDPGPKSFDPATDDDIYNDT